MSDFFKEMLSKVDNEFAQCAEDGIAAGDVDEYIDTGSYVLNALVSGSLFKGFPKNKITALAGEQGTGKTFFCLSTIASFLKQHDNGGVFIFESESALTKQTMLDFGIDTKRVYVFPVETIQQFRNQALVIADNYLKEEKKNRRPVLMVLDSLGMLSTSKEMEDIAGGKDTRDMTRAQLVRGAFRVLTLKLGKAGIPLLVTNHTYQTMDLFSKTEMGGGCLVAGTNVLTKKGWIPIEQITDEDFVFTKEGTFEKVLQTHSFNDKDVYEIAFDDGQIVRCSGEHKFLINGEWVESKNLAIGDELECI